MESLEKVHSKESKKKTADLEKEPRYNFEEIRELEQPMENLVIELQEAIDSGEYDALIGDDASGRIPTLILRKIFTSRIRELHPELTPEEDREMLKTFFIAGGYAENSPALLNFFKKIKLDVKKKALIITEYISSGESILRISKLLEEAGISFDVAAVSVDNYAVQFISQKCHLFSGGDNDVPNIYRKFNFSGV